MCQIAHDIAGKTSRQTHARSKQHTNNGDGKERKVQLCKADVNGKHLDYHRNGNQQRCGHQAAHLGEFLGGFGE